MADSSNSQTSLVPPRGLYVIFTEHGEPIRMLGLTENAVRHARAIAELLMNRPLPVSVRTGFPEFTLYSDGLQIGGG